MLASIRLPMQQVAGFVAQVCNPAPLVLDLLGLQKSPFVAQTRRGHRLLIRPNSGERFAFYENLIRRDYLSNGARLGEGDTVVDIGANVGCFSVLAASLIGSNGRLLAVEPGASSFEQLHANLRLNEVGNVIAVRAAVGPQNGTVDLRVAGNSLFTSVFDHVDRHAVAGVTEQVSCQTIATLLADHDIDHVDLMKIDCEGGEYGIFDSMTADLAARIDQISMEIHRLPNRTPEEIVQRLHQLGFQVRHTSPLYAHRIK